MKQDGIMNNNDIYKWSIANCVAMWHIGLRYNIRCLRQWYSVKIEIVNKSCLRPQKVANEMLPDTGEELVVQVDNYIKTQPQNKYLKVIYLELFRHYEKFVDTGGEMSENIVDTGGEMSESFVDTGGEMSEKFADTGGEMSEKLLFMGGELSA